MLTPDRIYYMNGVKINEKIIPDNARANRKIASWVGAGDPMKPGYKMSPIGVTIHNTDDLANVNDDAEQYTRATWPNCNMSGVVVHLYVDDLGAWQNLRFDESGWHASDGQGDGNRRTIAIEVIMDGKGTAASLKARDNAAKIVAYLLDKYNWTTDDIYTHNHWMGLPDKIVNGKRKNCPVFLLPDWDGFKKLVQKYYDESKGKTNESTTVNKVSSLSYKDIKVGDILQFNGDTQYVFAGAKSGKKTTSGRVKVTAKFYERFAHPIHVRSVDINGKFIKGTYGWVSLSDLSNSDIDPYIVRVAQGVKIYSGPSTDYKLVSTISKAGAYTIIEEFNGWGKLKSQIGWISLQDTERV